MKYILILGLLSCHCLQIFSQENNRLSPDSAIYLYNENFPQEKVYLQTDRTHYLSGETIWMKAWCTHAGLPTFLSNILYIDLTDKNGKVIQKRMYLLDSMGSAIPAIDIPDNAVTGNYLLRSYTLWMLNFPDFIFSKPIYIYNSNYKEEKKNLPEKTSLTAIFFPEGGNFVAGVKNNLAFKVVNQKGFPESVTGFISDNTNKKISDFRSEHDGMGSIQMIPEAGNSYIATISDNKGNVSSTRLPDSKDEGIALDVKNNNASRVFIVLNRADKNNATYNDLRVVAQMNSQIVFSAKVNIDAGEHTVAISKKNLPAGILQITIFNSLNMPLAERIVFIENYVVTKPNVEWKSVNTGPRKKNEFSFAVTNSDQTSLSLLVTDASLDTSVGKNENVVSSLLVSSDLKGNINNPGYYFIDKSSERLHHLDLLLMTQGWRRYNWNTIMKNEFPALKFPVESAITISGKVTKSGKTETVKDGYVSFIIKGEDSTSFLADATVTDKGEFLLTDVNYIKKATIFYMGTNKTKSTYIVDVSINPSYLDTLKSSGDLPHIDLDTIKIGEKSSSIAIYLNKQLNFQDTTDKKFKTLDEFTVKVKRVERPDSLNNAYAEGPFRLGKSVDPSECKLARTIWQIIQQAVPGVTVEGNPFNPNVSFNRFSAVSSGPETDEETGLVLAENGIAYFLNEINVTKEDINTLAVSDVALIKVLKNEGAALGASAGAIAIYTKKGVVTGRKPFEKTYSSMVRDGYSVTKEFYYPDYEINPELNKDVSDNRYTLYFNGRLKPKKDGRIHVKFFNNDITRKFKIIVQGIDKQGNMLYEEKIMH